MTCADLSWKGLKEIRLGSQAGARLRSGFIRGGVRRPMYHLLAIMLTFDTQFVYYIPNVVTQVVTLVFLGQHQHFLKYITTPAATAVASAQALRITRKIWKLGFEDRGHDLVVFESPQAHRETAEDRLTKNVETGLR